MAARRPRLLSTDRFRAGFRGTLKKILTTPVVLELGSAYCRVGFAGENAPRACFPLDEALPAASAALSRWTAALEPIVRRIFYRELLVTPSDRRVAVLENRGTPWALKEALAAALFALGVPHVVFLPAGHLPAFAASLRSGLLVDVGASAARVTPLLENVPVEGAAVVVPLGMRRVHRRFVRLVEGAGEEAKAASDDEKAADGDGDEKAPELDGLLDAAGVRDLVARVCFARPLPPASVLPDERVADEQRKNAHLPPHVWEPPALRQQPQPGPVRVRVAADGREVLVPGAARAEPADVLFDTSAASPTETSLGEAVLDALLACPPDARAGVASALLLVGGGAAVPGLACRLMEEIDNCLVRPRYAALRAFRRGIPVRRCAFPPTTAAWVGGSIVASFPLEDRVFLAKEDYESGAAVVPDWGRARARPAQAAAADEEETY